MCGIVGWLGSPGARTDRATLRAMRDSISHRGPDDVGEHFDEGAGLALGFRRLSIIDLSAASHQPMVDEIQDLVLIYNGELYNFRELRQRLQALGHRFRTSGDTEVVLRSFAEWGEAACERFAGMFALALWDGRRRRLLLARDAAGMKPLYLLRRPEGCYFASEVKAFLEVPGFRAEVDLESLTQFLEFGYVFDDSRTILSGVSKLRPGEVLVLERGEIRRRTRHFHAPAPEESGGAAPRVEALGSLLAEVVRQHLIADVPVGLLLSGGLDSSLVAALAAREQPITTVTMAFSESAIDEREPARRVAEWLGTEHHEVEIRPQEIADEVVDAAWVFDDLFADWGTVSTRILYRRFRQMGFKVALVGEGADELFGGYPVFEAATGLPTLWREFRLYQRYAGRRYGRQLRPFRAALEQSGVPAAELFERVRRFELERQLPSNYVMKVDKASMSESLEARAPYLDRRIMDLALRTPQRHLLRSGENKWLLREVARRGRLLPPEIANREKFGASIAATWLDQVPSFRSFAREVILDRSGWCDRTGLRRPMERFFSGRSGYPSPHPLSILQHLAWRLLLLNLWSRRYLDRPGRREDAPGMVASTDAEPAAYRPAAPAIEAGLVSVIVPVHNRPELLRDAVGSVLQQTYRPVEILIVDDGSTDETPRVAEELRAAHPECVTVLRQGNLGPGRAREAGRRAATGSYIQYLDSDDLLTPRKLELQVAALQSSPQAALAYGINQVLLPDGSVDTADLQSSDRPIERMFPTFLERRFWNTGAALLRRETSDAAGPWTELWLEEDWEYDCRIAALGQPICFVDEVVSRHRRVDGARLGRVQALDRRSLEFRARAHALIFEHAIRGGVARDRPEMRRFARELFLLARQCGAAGLTAESKSLFGLSRLASTSSRSRGLDFASYRVAATLLGWGGAGRLATLADRARFRDRDE